MTTALFCLALCSCEAVERVLDLDFYDLPDSRIENLGRLHTASTRHHYSAHFVGDLEHSFMAERRTIGGVTIGRPGRGDSVAERPEPIPNPSARCLELLTELLDFDSQANPRLAALQIAWCARIISEDPSFLSRERAILGLGPLARRIGIEGPVSLAIDAPRADADRTAELLADLIASWRNLAQGTGSESSLREDADAIAATVFDLQGSRRILPALAGLLGSADEASPGRDVLLELLEDFQRRTIQLSLARGLNLPRGAASKVRAAVVSASVEAGGIEMLARFMSVLQAERQAGAERDELLVLRILELVARYGFPDSFANLDVERYDRLRDEWYGLLLGFAVEDLEGRVRVQAMQALSRSVQGPDSLREEDWEAWYYARIDGRREKEGLPPRLNAAEESEGTDS